MVTQRIQLPWATEPFDLHLTPLHALIGPAGVGKTATLDVLHALYLEQRQGPAPSYSFRPSYLEAIGASWDLVQKYYPWIASIDCKTSEEGDEATFTSKDGQTTVLGSNGHLSSLIDLLWAITLDVFCKEKKARFVVADDFGIYNHPEQMADMMKLLRRTAESGVQVVLATNNPLVINEMRPEEVTLLTRGENGPRATLLKDTWNFHERARIYALGELWLSHTGNNEHLLLHEPPPARLPDEEQAELRALAELPDIPNGASGGMMAAHRRKMAQESDQIITEETENEGE